MVALQAGGDLFPFVLAAPLMGSVCCCSGSPLTKAFFRLVPETVGWLLPACRTGTYWFFFGCQSTCAQTADVPVGVMLAFLVLRCEHSSPFCDKCKCGT